MFYALGMSARVAKSQRVMRILMFHGLGSDYPTDVFEAQMKFLSAHFRVVPLADLIDKVADRQSAPDREIALTFDDGLRNNFTLAYPILKKLGIPATFFVCPGVIDSGKWIWSHEMRQRLLSASASQQSAVTKVVGYDSTCPDEFVEWMKTLPLERRVAVEDEIRGITSGFVPSDDERERFDPMSWDELCALSPDLITIGSHSVNHPILTSIDESALRYEVRESRRMLEEKLGYPVRYFCDPNGINNQRVVAEICGTYEAALTTRQGFVAKGDDIWKLKRIPTVADLPIMAWRLFRPRS